VCRFKLTERFKLLWNFLVYIVITCVDNFYFHLYCILGVVVANVVVGSMVVVVGSNVVVTSIVIVT